MAKTYEVYLNAADVAKHIEDNEWIGGAPVPPAVGTLRKHRPYDCLTTIWLGKATTKEVLVNFPIHFDYLKYVFDTCLYDTIGVTPATSQYFGYKTVSTPRVTRSSASTALINKRKSGSQAKQGDRVFFKIPAAALAQVTTGKSLVAAPSPTGGTKARRGGSLVFPRLATIPQIGLWFATHTPPARLADLGRIVNLRGTLVTPKLPADAAAAALEVGAFSATVKNKLNDSLAVKAAA